MPGHTILSGERAQRAVAMLRAVTDILDDASIRYWLDSGTLLGIVREQRLLPWDTDMDISVSSDQLPRLMECLPDLRRHGFRVRQRFNPPGDDILAAQSARLFKVRNRRWHFFRGDLLLDIFVHYRHGDSYYWGMSCKSSSLRLSSPAAFFDTLTHIPFEGKRYPAPSDTALYLTHRYGDWRTPVTRWNCFKDDGALVGV